MINYRGVMLPDPKGMVNPVLRDTDCPIPIVVGRVRHREAWVSQGGVIGCGLAISVREGYHSSSVLCWDYRFGYGQRRHCGVPHFVTSPLDGQPFYRGDLHNKHIFYQELPILLLQAHLVGYPFTGPHCH